MAAVKRSAVENAGICFFFKKTLDLITAKGTHKKSELKPRVGFEILKNWSTLGEKQQSDFCTAALESHHDVLAGHQFAEQLGTSFCKLDEIQDSALAPARAALSSQRQNAASKAKEPIPASNAQHADISPSNTAPDSTGSMAVAEASGASATSKGIAKGFNPLEAEATATALAALQASAAPTTRPRRT